MGRQKSYQPDDLKRMRRRARISRNAMAARLRISTGALSEWENGKRVRLPWDRTAADYLQALKELIAEGGAESAA